MTKELGNQSPKKYPSKRDSLLVDESYEVTKVINDIFGVRKSRTLILKTTKFLCVKEEEEEEEKETSSTSTNIISTLFKKSSLTTTKKSDPNDNKTIQVKKEIRAEFPWTKVIDVQLPSEMGEVENGKLQHRFIVKFFDYHDYIFESPLCYEIVENMRKRIILAQKEESLLKSESIFFSSKALDANSQEGDDFSRSLMVDEWVKEGKNLFKMENSDDDDDNSVSDSSTDSEESEDPLQIRMKKQMSLKRQASKLKEITGASEEDRIRTFISQIFGKGEIDSSLLESNSLKEQNSGNNSHHSVKAILNHFIRTYKKDLQQRTKMFTSKIGNKEKKTGLSSLRRFLTCLTVMIMERFEPQIKRLLIETKLDEVEEEEERKQIKLILESKNRHSQQTASHKDEDSRRGQLIKQYSSYDDLSSPEKKKVKNAFHILQESVEVATLLPLKSYIKNYIEKVFLGDYREQRYLLLKMKYMKKLVSPSMYGLPEEYHKFATRSSAPSLSSEKEINDTRKMKGEQAQYSNNGPSWSPAIIKLQEMNNVWNIFLPSKLLNILLAFTKIIYIQHTKAFRQQETEKKKLLKMKIRKVDGSTSTQEETQELPESTQEKPFLQKVISGDTLLPIFIHLIVHADLESPLEFLYICQQACHEDMSTVSESGYYLTMFSCALEYIKNFDFEEDDINEDFLEERNNLFSI